MRVVVGVLLFCLCFVAMMTAAGGTVLCYKSKSAMEQYYLYNTVKKREINKEHNVQKDLVAGLLLY